MDKASDVERDNGAETESFFWYVVAALAVVRYGVSDDATR